MSPSVKKMKKQEESKLLEIKKAAEILKNGGVVIFPTDTVYGIGSRFDDQVALNRIYKIKSRPGGQPFPVLVSSISQVESQAVITSSARKLIGKYWPGGLTIILNSKKGNGKIGFRMPRSSLITLLIDLAGVPIIGTSANFHGQKPAASFGELDPKLIELADFIIKGKSSGGIESTVVDATFDPPKILRQGAVKIKI